MKFNKSSRRADLRSLARLAGATALVLGVFGHLVAASAAASNTPVSEELRAMLPANVRDAGILNIAISLAYAPMEFSEPGSTELKGADIDFANEVAARLGLKNNFQNVDFSQLAVSLTTQRSDLIWTAFPDLPEYRDQLDFIDYFNSGNQLFAPIANQDNIKTVKDLCGKTVTVATGTDWVGFMENLSKEICDASAQINLLQIMTLAEQLMQMRQDRAQAAMIGSEGVLYLQQQNAGQYYAIGEPLNQRYYGVAFSKESNQLRDAVKATMDAMKADGTYQAILDRYGLKEAAVDTFTVNTEK